MPRFHQTLLIDKLNDYLEAHHRDVILEKGGHCHGLTLLWLTYMAEKKEKEFYHLLKRIIKLKEIEKTDEEIERLIAKIGWAQDPNFVINEINQLDIDKILDLPKKITFSAVIDQRKLETLIEKLIYPEQMVCLSSPNHTVGVFKRGETYYIYNPNFKNPTAKSFVTIADVKKTLLKILYDDVKLPTNRIALQVNIVENPDVPTTQHVNKMAVLESIVTNAEEAAMVDQVGVGGLHNSIENNDIDSVQYFLTKGAGVNQVRQDGQTPLIIAARLGYQNIVKLLLERGAKISMMDNVGNDALFHAVMAKHFDVAKTLLDSGANVLQVGTQNKLTTLEFFILEKNWEACRLLYPYVKNFPALSEENILLLNKHVNHPSNLGLFSRKRKPIDEVVTAVKEEKEAQPLEHKRIKTNIFYSGKKPWHSEVESSKTHSKKLRFSSRH